MHGGDQEESLNDFLIINNKSLMCTDFRDANVRSKVDEYPSAWSIVQHHRLKLDENEKLKRSCLLVRLRWTWGIRRKRFAGKLQYKILGLF